MRSIISETDSEQVQSDENGHEYIYRKDFIAGGDFINEFSLSLVYSRPGRIKTQDFASVQETQDFASVPNP